MYRKITPPWDSDTVADEFSSYLSCVLFVWRAGDCDVCILTCTRREVSACDFLKIFFHLISLERVGTVQNTIPETLRK